MFSYQVRLVLNPEVEILKLVKVLHTLPQLFDVPRDYNSAMEEQIAQASPYWELCSLLETTMWF